MTTTKKCTPVLLHGGGCSGVATVSKSLLIVLGTFFRECPPRTATIPPANSCQWFTAPPPVPSPLRGGVPPVPRSESATCHGVRSPLTQSLLAGGKEPLLGGHPFGGRVDFHNPAQLRVHLTFGLFPRFCLFCPNWLIICAGCYLPIPSAGNASPLGGSVYAI